MPTLSFSRLAFLVFALLSFGIIAGLGLLSSNAKDEHAELEVHEWGTFTSVAGRAGNFLKWRPLSVENDLPSFVYSIDKVGSKPQTSPEPQRPQPQPTERPRLRYPTKSATPVSVRMETPVLYFYAKDEMSIQVKVDFVGGKITEWFPQGRSVSGGSIDWGSITILPGAQVEFPNDFRKNHYYPARQTDAAPIQTTNAQREYEKFLFYRGVGNFDLPVSVVVEGNKVRIRNLYGEQSRRIVLFENREGEIGFRIQDMPQNELVLDRPSLDGKVETLISKMKAMLMSEGLYEKEAKAMLDTWRDSWFEEGLRVFYIMPRSATDEILPIEINPPPTKLVRVLVGRTELISPEIEERVINELRKLESPSMSVRNAALQAINKYGRFRESILKQILNRTTDPKLKAIVLRLSS